MATTLCPKPGKCLLQALGPVNMTRSRLISAVGLSGELGSLVTVEELFLPREKKHGACPEIYIFHGND